MKEPKLDKQTMISFLGDVISAEIEKANDEIDTELIAECDAFLAELITDVEISDEQMQNNIAKIKSKVLHTAIPTPQKNHRVPKIRRIFAAACAAVILLCAGITAYAFIPAFHDMVVSVLKLGCGSELGSGGVTFVYNGEMKKYKNIEKLVESENLDIIYPHTLPDGLDVKAISIAGEETELTYSISFVDNITSIVICHGEIDLSKLSDESEIFTNTHGVISYILIRDNTVVSTTTHGGWTYYITTNTMEDIKEILQNFY